MHDTAYYNRYVDHLFHFKWFFSRHGRFPSQRMLFNDVLYRIKTGPEIVTPLRIRTTDKEFGKEYISEVIGAQHAVPTLAILRTEAEIDAYDFPDICIVKSTHGSGDFVVVTPDERPDRAALKRLLRYNYYYAHRERNYKSLTGKIIVEPLLFEGRVVNDYKIFCWKGQARAIEYVNDRRKNYYHHMFDRDWTRIPIDMTPFGVEKPVPERPPALEKVLKLAEQLSASFDFVRVDFYIEKDTIYAGEITHCHWSAGQPFACFEDEVTFSRVIWPEAYE